MLGHQDFGDFDPARCRLRVGMRPPTTSAQPITVAEVAAWIAATTIYRRTALDTMRRCMTGPDIPPNQARCDSGDDPSGTGRWSAGRARLPA
jgi:hypothetical protein